MFLLSYKKWSLFSYYIADHVTATGHNIKWDHFKILAYGKTDYHCKIKEAVKNWCFISCCLLYSLLLRTLTYWILNLISRPLVIFKYIVSSIFLTVTYDHFWKCMLNSIQNVKFIKMRKLTMFITAVGVLFLIKHI